MRRKKSVALEVQESYVGPAGDGDRDLAAFKFAGSIARGVRVVLVQLETTGPDDILVRSGRVTACDMRTQHTNTH